jgi:hypothetical protein
MPSANTSIFTARRASGLILLVALPSAAWTAAATPTKEEVETINSPRGWALTNTLSF